MLIVYALVLVFNMNLGVHYLIGHIEHTIKTGEHSFTRFYLFEILKAQNSVGHKMITFNVIRYVR